MTFMLNFRFLLFWYRQPERACRPAWVSSACLCRKPICQVVSYHLLFYLYFAMTEANVITSYRKYKSSVKSIYLYINTMCKNNKTTAFLDYERCLYRTPLIGVLKLYTRLIIAVLFHHIKDINNIPFRQIILLNNQKRIKRFVIII